ncbi:MAG TPA: phasin family protein [bacterium]|nr:phasin family protein [bacterium]HOL47500.1 phasin family protein [bacterium]HPQ19578.1 phasin family protein [bacterium]
MLKDIIFSTIGLTSLLSKKIKTSIDDLISSGEMTKEEGEKIYKKLKEKISVETEEIEKNIEKNIQKVFEKLNIVTKNDLQVLIEKIENLEKKIK